MGIGAETFSSAEAFLDTFDRSRAGCLVTDERMPGMSGPELAKVVRKRRPDIKLLLTSGYVGPEGVPSDLPFVSKPWRVDQVARAVGLRSY